MDYVDIQVNGYAGVTFHGDPLTEDQIQHVATRLRQDNVRAVLPTVVADDPRMMVARLRRLRELIDQDDTLRSLMPAVHLEGPALSPKEGYRGAHLAQWLTEATPQIYEPLIDAAGGPGRVAIVTLAPEVDPGLRTTRWLTEQGIIVAAGHTDAPLEVLRDAEDAGLSLFTHLGNGAADQMHRHDNIINRALSLERISYSLIPDGAHVPFFLLKTWIRLVGIDRCLFTTDCVAPAGCPPGKYARLDGTIVGVGPDKVVRLPGTPYLAGAAITMPDAHRNAIDHLGLNEREAMALCSGNPACLVARWLR